MMGLEYAVVIEKATDNYCAYVPDLPGCVATGKTREETFQQISEAIVFHLERLKEDGLPIPEPESSAFYSVTGKPLSCYVVVLPVRDVDCQQRLE